MCMNRTYHSHVLYPIKKHTIPYFILKRPYAIAFLPSHNNKKKHKYFTENQTKAMERKTNVCLFYAPKMFNG